MDNFSNCVEGTKAEVILKPVTLNVQLLSHKNCTDLNFLKNETDNNGKGVTFHDCDFISYLYNYQSGR